MFWYDFIALALATIALMRAWFEGSLFIVAREKLKAWGGFFGELSTCPLCLTFYVAFVLAMLCIILPYWLPSPWNVAAHDLLYVLAAVCLIHFYWDVFPPKDKPWPSLPLPVPDSPTSKSSDSSDRERILPFNASQSQS